LFYSNSYLSPLGRHAEALDEMQKAVSIDPFSAPVQAFLGRTYIWARQYGKAMAQFQKCAEMFPGFAIDHERMSQLYAFLGKFEDAITEDTKARLLSGKDEKSALRKEAALRRALATGSSHGYWEKMLELTMSSDNPPEAFGSAIPYVQLGRKAKALDALEKSYQQRSLATTEIAIEPAFNSIHGEPRFQDLLRRMALDSTIAK
jgi:tetratricopeptide (TPR) repeat protein